MSCRKKIGWRGPCSPVVSVMTGALKPGVPGAAEAGWAAIRPPAMAIIKRIPLAVLHPTVVAKAVASISNPGMVGQRHGTATACGREECSAPAECRTSPGSVGTRQQVMLETDHIHESVDCFEVGEFHPAPADTVYHFAVAHRVFHRASQTVGEDQLLFFAVVQHERPAHPGFHRVEKAELAASDLVHPHPLPGDAHEHHLLGDVAQRADSFARPLEASGGELGEIAGR